jgi:virginiamycin A acetyltransferase
MGIVKRSLKKILSVIALKKNPGNESYIVDSKITRPYLVDKFARIQYSELRGGVVVGPNTLIYKTILEGNITIGRNTTINGPSTEFHCLKNSITIGNFCSIARGTTIQEYNHNVDAITTYFIRYRVFNEPYGQDVVSKGPVNIGNDVWIGSQCMILSGVTIGDGAVIAANSVVTKNVPPYTIFAGSPAKIVRQRFPDDIVKKLMELKWWHWTDEEIKLNDHLFKGNLTTEKLNAVKTK